MTAADTTGQAVDRLLVAKTVGLLNDAEHYVLGTPDERLAYLDGPVLV
ncbi:hypothetical protein [Streptomyces sp. CB03578]|nr:hypothetical protein [Streptomyces sp. CB03578]